MSTVHPGSAAEWRAWLARCCGSEREVWLVIERGGPLGYAEAVEHALCFGWIDGLHRKRDASSSQLRFTPRDPRSGWSGPNRDRAERMAAAGLMTARGQALVDLARATGTWDVGEVVPDDLRALLDGDDAARAHFAAFPPSSKRLILEWIATAKRPGTRARRLAQAVELAARGVRANHPGTPRGRGRP